MMAIKPKELHPIHNRGSLESGWRNFWHGRPPRLVAPAALTGRMTPYLKGQIAKRVNEIANQSDCFKIGAMGDTYVRMDGTDYRGEFKNVQRIYKSKSQQVVIDLEVYLIKRFKKDRAGKILNKSETPAWRLTSYNGFYYVYVVYND